MIRKDFTTIVVTGAKRSGTTLMQYLLDSVPEVFNILDESYFWEYLYDIGEGNVADFVELMKTAPIDDLVQANLKRSLLYFFDKGYAPRGTVNTQRIDISYDINRFKNELSASRSGMDGTVEYVWRMWVNAMVSARGCDKADIKWVVVKSPDYGKSVISSLKYLANPKIIIVVRDPRYAIDSLKRSRQLRREKEVHLFELFSILNEYKRLERAIDKLKPEISSGKITVLKYEELVSAPEAKMRDIARFAGVKYHEIMLKPTFSSQLWHGESSFETFNSVSKAPTERKLGALTVYEMRYIEKLLSEFLRRFDYPVRLPETAVAVDGTGAKECKVEGPYRDE